MALAGPDQRPFTVGSTPASAAARPVVDGRHIPPHGDNQEARGSRHAAGAAEGRFVWPLHPVPPVVRSFDPPDSPFGAGHRGVDLGGSPGLPVMSAGAGVVIFSGALAGRGVISIDHDAIRTTYEPVRPLVKAGDRVYAGQRIGTLMAGHGECEEACLHWGARRGTPPEYLDPVQLVALKAVIRLKPWTG